MLNIPEYPMAARVFYFFEEISKIPHGSANTALIKDYLVSFAKARGLYVKSDDANNVIIRKNATRGYTERKTVTLQGHIDMVAEKTADSKRDMLTEGIEIYRDGDFLRAKDTTLGGDDGIMVAYALALLDADDIEHPELEAVFTSDEEIGLLGAVALDGEEIKGRMLINIDSDCEGVFTVGCAGGMRIDLNMPTRVTKSTTSGYKITVFGLLGGHSGVEINKGRENAIKIMGEILRELDARISSISGGNADNAIPRTVSAVISAEGLDATRIREVAASVTEKYRKTESCIGFTVDECECAEVITAEDSKKVIGLICDEPSGVVAMSEDILGLVETSLNMGIIRCGGEELKLTFSVRSAKGAEKEKLATRVKKIAESYGATHSTHGEYPAWEYKKDSHLCEVMCEVYKEMYGKDARVVTIHAGLECGIFCDKIAGLECVSIGPDNFDIHTTEERLSISSVARVWEFLKEVLKKI